MVCLWGVPGGSDGKESACNVGDLGPIAGSERSPGEGNGNPLQCSCLENSMDRGAWRATVHGVTNSLTRRSVTPLPSRHSVAPGGILGLPGGTSGKGPVCQRRGRERCRLSPWVRRLPRRRAWQPTPAFLPGESHGQTSLVGSCLWGRQEWGMTEAS